MPRGRLPSDLEHPLSAFAFLSSIPTLAAQNRCVTYAITLDLLYDHNQTITLLCVWDAIPYIQGFRDLLLISSDCLTVLLPSLFIILYFSLLSCLAPSKRGRARMERKRTTMGEAAQIRCKSALPPPVYIPPIATLLLNNHSSSINRRKSTVPNKILTFEALWANYSLEGIAFSDEWC